MHASALLFLAFSSSAFGHENLQAVLEISRSNGATGKENLSSASTPDPPYDVYPFVNDVRFTVIPAFLNNLYVNLNDDKKPVPWIDNDYTAHMYPFTTFVIGDPTLTPVSGEDVGTKASPRFMLSEVWRVSNLMHTVIADGTATTPVAQFFKTQGNDALANALFPAQIRDLLSANEVAIQKAQADGKSDWLGFTPLTTASLAPFPAVQVAHAGPSKIGYYQRGAVGPLSLEAAFLLASQVVGIDWVKLAHRTQGDDRFWWVAGLRTVKVNEKCDGTSMKDLHGQVTVEFAARPPTSHSTGDQRAGFNLLIDVDHDRPNDDTRNVFLFAVHSIDVHSRVEVPTLSSLKALKYTTYTPPKDEASTPLPGAAGAPPAGSKKKDNIRFFAHAHAAVLPYTKAMKFIGQQDKQCELMDEYAQGGFLHMYILAEDEDPLWPRQQYMKTKK